MFEPKVTLTREELYEKVWSTPMQKLACEFGFSDVGFAKLCHRHQIPVPPRGYWARVHVGQSVKRTPLPTAKESRFNTIEIYQHERRPPGQSAEIEAQEIPNIVVADVLPLEKQTVCQYDAKTVSFDRHGLDVWAVRPAPSPQQLAFVPRALNCQCLRNWVCQRDWIWALKGVFRSRSRFSGGLGCSTVIVFLFGPPALMS